VLLLLEAFLLVPSVCALVLLLVPLPPSGVESLPPEPHPLEPPAPHRVLHFFFRPRRWPLAEYGDWL